MRMNRSINMMVISISIYYAIGTVPYSLVFLLSQFMNIDANLRNYSTISLYIFHGTGIFIFYLFNKLYRQTLNGYLKSLVSVLRSC